MGTYRSVLESIERGVSISRIALSLDRREDVIRGMIESMIREGLIDDLDCDDGTCSACPMAESCGFGMDIPRSYYVTDRGREYLYESTGTVQSSAETDVA